MFNYDGDFDFSQFFRNEGTAPGGVESTLLAPEELIMPTSAELALMWTTIIDTLSIRKRPNESNYVNFEDGNQGVFKPGIGEECLEFREACHKLFQRERAVFVVDKMFNFNVIPATIIREVDHRIGSIQQVIWEYTLIDNLYDARPHEAELSTLSALDYFTWNRDRKPDHKTVSQGKLWGIDNGLSMDNWSGDFFSNHLRNNLNAHLSGKQLPAQLVANVRHFNESPAHQASLREELRYLVPESAINAFFARVAKFGDVAYANNGVVNTTDLTDFRGNIEYFPS